MPGVLDQLRSLAGQIEDGELRRGVEGFYDRARQMADLNGELLAVLAGCVNLPSPQDRHDRRRLRDRLRRFDGAWLPLVSFQKVLAQGARIYRTLIHGKRQVGERLAELRARLPAQAEKEPEPDMGLRLMEGPVGIALWVATWLSWRHQSGLPDVTGEWRALGEEALAALHAAMPGIGDPALHAAAGVLYADLEWQVQMGERVLEEVARAVGLPVPQDEAGREVLWGRLAECDSVGLVWLREPALQHLRQEAQAAVPGHEENRLRILARQGELRAEALAEEKSWRAAAGDGGPGPAGDPS